ncbi:unnamed protein product, partial [Rotaria sordida]
MSIIKHSALMNDYSLSYIIYRWSTTFHIEPIVLNTISLIQQQIISNKITFEQLLAQVYSYYNEQIKAKFVEFHFAVSLSPFPDPVLFTNSYTFSTLTIMINIKCICYSTTMERSATISRKNMPINALINFCDSVLYREKNF